MSKIAYIGIKGLPSKGGAERAVEAIINRLKGKHKLAVYCSGRYTPKDANLPGVELIRIPCFSGKHLRSFSLFLLSAFHAILKGGYDLIHLHNAEACFIVPFLRTRYRVIVTSHGPAYAREKWSKIAKSLLRLMEYFFVIFPNRLTSVSLPMAKEYEARLGREVQYIPNGVENRLPVNLEVARQTLEKNGVRGEYVLFVAGRMDRTKGCHLLLDAFRRVDSDLNLVVIGDSQTDQAYSLRLRELGDKRVYFIPFIADKGEFFGILAKAKIFIFASTIEAMSMALLEAASLGVPIICSDIPANTAVLPEHALHFRSGNVEDLWAKLNWAIAHPEKMKEMGLKTKEWVNQEFSWDVIAGKYDHLYQSVHNKT